MGKKKPVNSEQHLDEVLPAVPSPSDDFDGDDGSDDTQEFTATPTLEPSEIIAALNAEIARLKAERDSATAEAKYAHAAADRLQTELNAARSAAPIRSTTGETAWYFDASQNPTPLAVPVGVAYGKTQQEALSKFLARSGVGTLAKSPVCEVATAEQIKQYGAK